MLVCRVAVLSAWMVTSVACASPTEPDPACRCVGELEGVGHLDIGCGEATCASGVGIYCVSDGVARGEPSACGTGSGCGDGVCAATEDATSCMPDCMSMCGDMVCSPSELPATCPVDCGTVCGDGTCGPGENPGRCEYDCPARCGDGYCTHGEGVGTCGADCAPVCGDSVCSVGETCTACERDCGICVPEFVDVRLVGAIVAPYDDAGETWDLLGHVSSAERSAIQRAALATGNPYAAAATVLSLIANDLWQDADVHGRGSVAVDGVFMSGLDATLDAVTDDTPNAEWVGPPGWDNAPSSRTRVRVVLWDEDVVVDDRIGTVDLSREHLEDAYRAARIYPVPVANQGSKILFVRISVTASP